MNIGYIWARLLKKIRGKAIKNCQIDSTVVINAGSQIVNSHIGRYSNVGYDCTIVNTNIGNFTCLADFITIGSAQHPMTWVSMSPVFENVKNSGSKKRFAKFDLDPTPHTIIGSDVWIGHGAIIKAGVTIGHGAVIGTGAVVTKDVEPYTVVAGCPAKIIRKRFSDEIIKRLLNSNWWNFCDDKLQSVAHAIREPEKFLKILEI